MPVRAHVIAWLAVVALTFAAEAAEVKKLDGPVLAMFDEPPDDVVMGTQFGVFRNDDPPDRQFIEDKWRELRAGGDDGKFGFLVLAYNVSGTDTYNGWWLKLGDADWTTYRNGELVLLLRRLDPKVDTIQRGVRLSKPDTPGPSRFKLELKSKASDGSIQRVGLGVRVDRTQLGEQAKNGFFELRIPLADFAINLQRMHEFVIVLENNRLLPSEHRGAIGIRAVALTNKRAQPIEQVLYDADRLLDELGRKTFAWFQKHRHPVTGLVLDRAPNRKDFEPRPEKPAMASIASVGYYLSLLPEWVRLDYVSEDEAKREAERTLRFVLGQVEHHKGVAYHFVDWQSGKRWGKSEVSTLDTAILMNGAIVTAVAFGDPVAKLTDELLNRADWPAFVVDHARSGEKLLSLGWSPEKGLLHPADVRSSEMAMAYFLAIGSKQAIDPQCWYNTTVDYYEIGNRQVLNAQHPLFTSYYGLGWHDLADKVDRDKVDLHENARLAALLNRHQCRKKSETCSTYAESNGGWWGISAGDAPTGYVAPGPLGDDADCVVWPMTSLAALPWIPDQVKGDLLRWRGSALWAKVNGEFGLRPFRLDRNNPKRVWFGQDLIGIDLGAFAVSLANYRAGTVGKLWGKHPVAVAAYQRLGIVTGN